MALEEVTATCLKRLAPSLRLSSRVWTAQCRRYATQQSAVSVEDNEVESSPFTTASTGDPADFDPLARSRKFKTRLPPSRYSYRSPRYDRGPLNPARPPKPSDPNSREFIPGPFTLPRLEQTYHDTFAQDLMTLAYQHLAPGEKRHVKGPRLRQWVGESPYFKNRPLRGPRGGDVLRLLRKPITFDSIPELQRVTIHTMAKNALDDSGYLATAGMVLQAISNVRAETFKVKKQDATFGLKPGKYVSAKVELHGEDMYHFLSKFVDVVMPKFKDFKGAKGSSGDNSGNIAIGLTPEQVALFPEIEVNYDM